MNNGFFGTWTDWVRGIKKATTPLVRKAVQNFLNPVGSLATLEPDPPGANGAAQGGQGGVPSSAPTSVPLTPLGASLGASPLGGSSVPPRPINQAAQNSNATYRASETGRYANGNMVYSASNPSPYATPLQGAGVTSGPTSQSAYQQSERSSTADIYGNQNSGTDTQGNTTATYIAPGQPLPMLSDANGNASPATPQEMQELGYVQTSNGGWNLSSSGGSGAVNNSINVRTGGGHYQHFQTQQAYDSWARRKARNEKKDKINHSGATTAVSSILGTG